MYISVENFEKAIKSLVGYWGVIGIFGGNPVLHPEIPLLCEILKEHIPLLQRGIWCNNPLHYGSLLRQTFNPNVSNLNVHMDQKAYDTFKSDWPECNPVGLTEDSRHSPVHGSMKALIADESERNDLIANCDINKYWSAMIGQFRGQVRAWFCEVAGAQAMLHQYLPDYPDTGLSIPCAYCTINTPSCPECEGKPWWAQDMSRFSDQVKQHCHNCLVPLKGFGELAVKGDGAEMTTPDLLANRIYVPKGNRTVLPIVELKQLKPSSLKHTTSYLQNAKNA